MRRDKHTVHTQVTRGSHPPGLNARGIRKMSEYQGDSGRQVVFTKVRDIFSGTFTSCFARMESDSDQSDEDSVPEITKMAKKKLHRDLMFHMEM